VLRSAARRPGASTRWSVLSLIWRARSAICRIRGRVLCFPERFVERLELPTRVENALALGFAGRRLIASLCGWLAARGGGISECTFEFAHERGARQRSATVLSPRFHRRHARLRTDRSRARRAPATDRTAGRCRADQLAGRGAGGASRTLRTACSASAARALAAIRWPRWSNVCRHALAMVACMRCRRRPSTARRMPRDESSLAAGREKSSARWLAARSAGNGLARVPCGFWPDRRPCAKWPVGRSVEAPCVACRARAHRKWLVGCCRARALGDVRRDYFVAISVRQPNGYGFFVAGQGGFCTVCLPESQRPI
jgi:hypothetical protein